MTTHAPVPAVREAGRPRAAALALICLLALALLPLSTQQAFPQDNRKVAWIHGTVDRTSGEAILVRGNWHELARAIVVDAYGRRMSGADIKKGAYIHMRLINGVVTDIHVYQDLGR